MQAKKPRFAGHMRHGMLQIAWTYQKTSWMMSVPWVEQRLECDLLSMDFCFVER
jgi:hypothetical protein